MTRPPQVPPPDRSGDRIHGKYELIARIAVGGMGEVYRARNVRIGRDVAIKLLRPDLAREERVRERFRREAQLANFVRHAHVVEILDIDDDESGIPFIVQELLHGEDLAGYIERAGGALPVDVTLAIVEPVAEAVGAAHEKGLVHRDLKPENIFLAAVDEVLVPKILDFGISRVSQTVSGLQDTDGPLIVGSPTYMSPEQIRAPKTVDERTDVWALGVILYECLAGRRPFDATDVSKLFVQICREDPPPIRIFAPDVSNELVDLVRACLSRDMNVRPMNGHEVADTLRMISDALPAGGGELQAHSGGVRRVGGFAVAGRRRISSSNLTETAPDLSDHGTFRVPTELALDLEHASPEVAHGVRGAVARASGVDFEDDLALPAPRRAPAPPPAYSEVAKEAELDLELEETALPPGRASRPHEARASRPSGEATAAAKKKPQKSAKRPGRAYRVPDVPSVGAAISVGCWLALGAVAVGLFARPELPPQLASVGGVGMLGVLATVIALVAVAIVALLRARDNRSVTLLLAGLGGLALPGVVLALALFHYAPNVPGIREHRDLTVALAAASLAVVALGVGVRTLIGGYDAFRDGPPRPLYGLVLVAFGITLVAGAGLVGAALYPETAPMIRERAGFQFAIVAPPAAGSAAADASDSGSSTDEDTAAELDTEEPEPEMDFELQ